MPFSETIAEPVDDPSIPLNARLWRRVFPKLRYWDQQRRKYRPASGAFRDHNPQYPGLSVYVVSETTVEAALKDGPWMDVVEFSVGVARAKNCRVVRDDHDEKGHVLIFGSGTGGRLMKSQAEHIAGESTYVVPDPSTMLPPAS
jgi:hypothetical protein